MARPAKKLSPKQTQQARERLPRDVETFLAAGGKVTKIETGVSGEIRSSFGKHYQYGKTTPEFKVKK